MGKAAWGNEAVKRMCDKMVKTRDEFMKDVDNIHVKLQKGNSKTGHSVWTVSLLPIIDCYNCSGCKNNCYDLKSDVTKTVVLNDRVKNSAVHKVDRERFWREIENQIKVNYVETLRLNVGGDLDEEDFKYVNNLAKNNDKTDILFFTKNYDGINKFLSENEFAPNVHPIMSAWEGMEMENPNNLPCSHVLYEDGRTTAPEYGAYYCGGNCTECHFKDEGCWNLKNGEHVIFRAH